MFYSTVFQNHSWLEKSQSRNRKSKTNGKKQTQILTISLFHHFIFFKTKTSERLEAEQKAQDRETKLRTESEQVNTTNVSFNVVL